jgi:hypothetical protein
MAAKRKSTKKTVASKKTATAKKQSTLDDLRYSSGKIEDGTIEKIQEIEEILGVKEVNHFGTNDINVLEDQLKEMTLADLQNLCGKVRLFASGNKTQLRDKLRKEFTRTTRGQRTIAMRQQVSICNPEHPDHDKAKKILSDGF